MTDEDTVYVAVRRSGGHTGHYHTDPNCSVLEKANAVAEKSLSVFPEKPTLCQICAGTKPPGGKLGSQDLRKKLEAMEPEEAGLSPLNRGEQA